jgi:hypothetical protein
MFAEINSWSDFPPDRKREGRGYLTLQVRFLSVDASFRARKTRDSRVPSSYLTAGWLTRRWRYIGRACGSNSFRPFSPHPIAEQVLTLRSARRARLEGRGRLASRQPFRLPQDEGGALCTRLSAALTEAMSPQKRVTAWRGCRRRAVLSSTVCSRRNRIGRSVPRSRRRA